MSPTGEPRPRVLLVGGTGGLVGRAIREAFGSRFQLRSVHRNPLASEQGGGVEWIGADVALVKDWAPILDGVDCVINLAWYRWESPERFRTLADGLLRLFAACSKRGGLRVLHVSVPPAPEALETGLPYLSEKRRVDRALAASGLSYRILRPTLLFGPGDRLLTVMLRLVARYHRFPMFGDGEYHVSPIAASDLARALLEEIGGSTTGISDLGGPTCFRYRDLTDRLFSAFDLPPRYVGLGRRSALGLTRLMVATGSTLLYPYEVEWLMSDLLGLPPYGSPTGLLRPVEPFLREQAAALRAQV